MQQKTGQTAKNGTVLDHLAVMRILPHRYPFLLIDKVRIVEAQKSAVGIKTITNNEPQLVGHFPGNPIMPGVLIIESMAQTAAIVMAYKNPALGEAGIDALREGKAMVYLVGVDGARFRRPAVPGDVLEIAITLTSSKAGLYKFDAAVTCDGSEVARAVITAVYRAVDQ